MAVLKKPKGKTIESQVLDFLTLVQSEPLCISWLSDKVLADGLRKIEHLDVTTQQVAGALQNLRRKGLVKRIPFVSPEPWWNPIFNKTWAPASLKLKVPWHPLSRPFPPGYRETRKMQYGEPWPEA